MPVLDLLNLTNISVALTIIGSIGIIVLAKPIDKVIMFGLLQGGFIGMIAAAKYLDVAMAAAIFDPISTIILLIGIIKLDEIRKKKQKQKSKEEGFLV